MAGGLQIKAQAGLHSETLKQNKTEVRGEFICNDGRIQLEEGEKTVGVKNPQSGVEGSAYTTAWAP